jgi:HD-GYP domain-containing protein (c-di-GMP phosphodiesterase class II)
MNNINSYIRNIRSIGDLDKLLKANSFILPHGEKVSSLAIDIANSLNLSDKQIETISIASKYHDAAYIFYPQEIQYTLNIHNESQLQAILAHPYISAELLGALFQSKEIFNTILAHHELFNGTGFPYKLKVSNIPIESAIIGISDFYCTLTGTHKFFDAFKIEDILMYMYEQVDKIFSERLFFEFVNSLRKQLRQDEIHFIETDRKIHEWRLSDSKIDVKYSSVSNKKMKKDVPNFEDTLKKIIKNDSYIKWSIL